MHGCYFAHAQDDMNLLILRMLEGAFSFFNTARIIIGTDQFMGVSMCVVDESVRFIALLYCLIASIFINAIS